MGRLRVGIGDAVRPHHGPGPPHDPLQILLALRVEDGAGAQPVGDQQVALGVEGILSPRPGDLIEHPPGILRMGGGPADHGVLEALPGGLFAADHRPQRLPLFRREQLQQRLHAQGVQRIGKIGRKPGGRRRIGILVAEHITAPRRRLLHQREGRGGLVPVEDAAGGLVVRDNAAAAALLRHPEHLRRGLHQPCALAAHVDGEQAALFRRRPGQRDQLLRLRVASRRIDQAEGKAQRARVHALCQQRLHLAQLLRRGPAVFIAHDAGPQHAVAHQKGGVGPQRLFGQIGKIILQAPPRLQSFFVQRLAAHPDAVLQMRPGHGCRRFAAHPAHKGGDALADVVPAGRVMLQSHVLMAVGVDKAGTKHQPPSVNHGLRRALQPPANGGDFSAGNARVAEIAGAAGAVQDLRVPDQNVIVHALAPLCDLCPYSTRPGAKMQETALFSCGLREKRPAPPAGKGSRRQRCRRQPQ